MSNFGDLVNIEEFGNYRNDFNPDRGGVAFYCKDCKTLVEVERPNPKGYIFICKNCSGKNIVLGTKEGLKTNYKLKD